MIKPTVSKSLTDTVASFSAHPQLTVIGSLELVAFHAVRRRARHLAPHPGCAAPGTFVAPHLAGLRSSVVGTSNVRPSSSLEHRSKRYPGLVSDQSSKSATETVIDALYGRFLLRDLFAKMVPGCLVMLSVLFGQDFVRQSPERLTPALDYLDKLGWPAIALAAGFTWILGFAIQDVGEFLRFVRHHPPRFDDAAFRYRRRDAFKNSANRHQREREQRYTLIKEATGNAGTALLLSCAIVVIHLVLAITEDSSSVELSQPLLALLVFIGLGASLLRANRSHARKQYNHIETVLEGSDARSDHDRS